MVLGRYISMAAALGMLLLPATGADAKRKSVPDEVPTEAVSPRTNPLQGIYNNIETYIKSAKAVVQEAESSGSKEEQIDAKAELTVYKVLEMDVQGKAPLEVKTEAYRLFDELGDYKGARDGSSEVMYDVFDALMAPTETTEESIDSTRAALQDAQSLQSSGCLGYQTFVGAIERVTGLGVNEAISYSDAIRVILNDDVNITCGLMAGLGNSNDGPADIVDLF